MFHTSTGTAVAYGCRVCRQRGRGTGLRSAGSEAQRSSTNGLGQPRTRLLFFFVARTQLCCAQLDELDHICRPTIFNILHKAQQFSPTRSSTPAKQYCNQHKPGANLSGWPIAGIESNPCCSDDCCVQASRRLHAVARAKPGRLAPHASSCYHLTHLPLHTSTLCPLS